MTTPDAASVRFMSKVDFEPLGYGDDDELQVVVDQANAYVAWVSGRPLDDTLPTELTALANQAVRMRSEQVAFQSQPDYIETATDDAVQSFSAGSYSETRRDQSRRGEQKALNSWAALSEILWMLMTDDKYDYWQSLLSGVHAPAFAVTEVAWQAYTGGTEADVPWLVEPRGARFPAEDVTNLNSWSW